VCDITLPPFFSLSPWVSPNGNLLFLSPCFLALYLLFQSCFFMHLPPKNCVLQLRTLHPFHCLLRGNNFRMTTSHRSFHFQTWFVLCFYFTSPFPNVLPFVPKFSQLLRFLFPPAKSFSCATTAKTPHSPSRFYPHGGLNPPWGWAPPKNPHRLDVFVFFFHPLGKHFPFIFHIPPYSLTSSLPPCRLLLSLLDYNVHGI